MAEALSDQLVQAAGAVGEGVSLYAHSFLHGDKQVGKWNVPAEGEVLSMLIAHVFATSEDQGVIVIVMGLAVATAVKNAGVI